MEVILDRILVRRLTGKEDTTAGGIIMPHTDKAGGRDTQTGEVLSIGPGAPLDNGKYRPIDISVGDVVTFGYHVGWYVRHGDELMVISEADVVAVERCGE